MAGGIVRELFASFGFKIDRASVSAVNSTLSGIKSAAAGIGATLSLVGIGRMVEEFAELGTKTLSLSKQIGVSATSLQQWSYVAKQAGGDANTFARATGVFELNLRKFSEGRGSKDVRQVFADLGVSGTEAAKALNSPDGLNNILFHMSDRLKKLGNTGNTAAEIKTLFGARSSGVAAIMEQGGDALKGQIGHVTNLGGILDDKTLQNLKELNNGINDLKLSFTAGLANAFAAAGPEILETIGAVTHWIGEHTEQIKDFVTGMFDGIHDALAVFGAIFNGIFTAVNVALEAFGIHTDKATIAGYALGAVLTFLAGRFVFAWAAAFGPIGLAVLAVAALVGVIAYYWDEIVDGVMIVGEKIKEAFEAVFTWIGNLPIIKQLREMMDWADKHMDKQDPGVQKVLDARAEKKDSSWLDRAGAWSNNFLNNHSTVAALVGGGGEMVRKSDEFAKAVGAAPTTIMQNNTIVIHDATDPQKVGAAVDEHLGKKLRDAHGNFNGGQ